MIALQDPDFLDDVPADRPAMIVAGGVMMIYFEGGQWARL
jgi:hypothetical protein